MPQQTTLLDPHKFDDKSGVPSTGTDAEMRALVVDMLKAGHSDDEVKAFIQKVDDLKDPTGARIAGAMSGIGPGLLTGLIGVPMMVKDAVLDGISMLQGRDPENAKAFIDSVHTFLPKLKDAGPREQAKMVSELATSFGVGAGTGGGAFAARKPLAKAMGATLSEAATHPGAVRLASGGAMLHGFYNGSPTEMGMGLAGMSVPDAIGSIGNKLYKYGADGAEYVPRKMRGEAPLPSGARSIDTGPVNSLNLAPATSGPQGTSRVPQVGMPATANSRVQKVMADEAKSESAVAGRQAKTSAETPDINDPVISINGQKGKLSSFPESVQRTFRAQDIGSTIKAGDPARPAIRVTASPSAAAVMEPPVAPAVERRVRAGQAPGGTERRLAATADDLPPTGSVAERAAALRKENPYIDEDAASMAAKAAAARVHDTPNYMTEDDVANIGGQAAKMGDETLNTLREAGHDVPADGLRSTGDIDRAIASPAGAGSLTNSPAFKDLQESIRKSNEPVPTPSNLHMGSDASPKELAADVRVRAQGGGGIRIDGSRPGQPISLVKGVPAELPEEAANVLKQYLAENPEADPAVVEASLRKLMGGSE
jgi:hypothetical protein